MLTPKEFLVTSNYFEFNRSNMTLSEISLRLNISNERVRQLKNNALKKIRASSSLKDFIMSNSTYNDELDLMY